MNDSLKSEWKVEDLQLEKRNCDILPSSHSELSMDRIETFGSGVKEIKDQYDNLGEMLDANQQNSFELIDSDKFVINSTEKSGVANESQRNSNVTKDVFSIQENKQQNDEVIARMISKPIKNYRPFEGSVDVPKPFQENKEDLSNSVISATASVCTTGNTV